MQERCQKNYVIIMTDGEPTQDRDSRLYETPYINGDIIGDYDDDQTPCDPTNHREYWDPTKTVWPIRTTARTTWTTSPSTSTRTTATRPWATAPPSTSRTSSPSRSVSRPTSRCSSGRRPRAAGEYFTAENYSELKEAFDQIMSSIVEKNACYVAPVVPISRMNRVFAGDKIYLGFFKPQQSGRWIGNIKRYALQNDGTLVDAKSQPTVRRPPTG